MSLTVTLPDEVATTVQDWLASGLYSSAQEAIAKAISLLAARQSDELENLAWLRRAVQEGLDSGEDGPWDPAEVEKLARQMRADGEFD